MADIDLLLLSSDDYLEKREEIEKLKTRRMVEIIQSTPGETDTLKKFMGRKLHTVLKQYYPHWRIHSMSDTECDPVNVEIIQENGTISLLFHNFVCIAARFFDNLPEEEEDDDTLREIEKIRDEIKNKYGVDDKLLG